MLKGLLLNVTYTENGALMKVVTLDTAIASARWADAKDWDGQNHIHRSTGSQWTWETLYRSKRGRYYIVTQSSWQGSTPQARFVTDEEAAAWLVLNDHELPPDLVGCQELIE